MKLLPPLPGVVLGLQGVQYETSVPGGVAESDRYPSHFVRALLDYGPQVFAAVSIDPEEPRPPILADIPKDVPILSTGDSKVLELHRSPLVFHALTPAYELSLETLWPAWARDPAIGLAVSVTDHSFRTGKVGSRDPLVKARTSFLERADAVLASSFSVATDVSGSASIDPERLFTVLDGVPPGSGPLPFGRPGSLPLPEGLELLHPFIVAIGDRRHLEVVLRGYSRLTPELQRLHQLVLLVTDGFSLDGDWIERDIDGLCGRVSALRHADQTTTRLLLQTSELALCTRSSVDSAAIPLEAMACGAVVVAADVDPMREVLEEPSGRFNPGDPFSVESILLRSLTDIRFRESRRRKGSTTVKSRQWRDSVSEALRAYSWVAAHRSIVRTRRHLGRRLA